MKSNRLPISICHAHCTSCRFPADFQMFGSGPGGDFSTYIGKNTHDVYRLGLAKVHYLNKSTDELLSPAIEREGGIANLLQVPEHIKCKVCGTVFSAESCVVDGEVVIDAFEL